MIGIAATANATSALFMEYRPIVMVDLSGMLDAWCVASSQPLDGTGRSAGVYGRSHEHGVSNHAACGGPSGVARGRGRVGRSGVSVRGYELSHDGEAYTVRVFTPASRGDWRLALEHVARLARSVDATIVDEKGVESTPDTVGGSPFEQDIRFGVEQIASVVRTQGEVIIPGLVRHVTFDRQMMDAVTGSNDPVARFESLMRTVQEVDAYEAKQLIVREPDGEVVGVYQISQDQATILPLAKPRPTPENQEKLTGREVSSW